MYRPVVQVEEYSCGPAVPGLLCRELGTVTVVPDTVAQLGTLGVVAQPGALGVIGLGEGTEAEDCP